MVLLILHRSIVVNLFVPIVKEPFQYLFLEDVSIDQLLILHPYVLVELQQFQLNEVMNRLIQLEFESKQNIRKKTSKFSFVEKRKTLKNTE